MFYLPSASERLGDESRQQANFRIFLPVPAKAEFKVQVLGDPYGCENSPRYGLPAGMLSMYRRPLNATNLTRNAQIGTPISAQGTIMWDGREPSLQSQFVDATLGHALAKQPPTSAQVAQGVNFEQASSPRRYLVTRREILRQPLEWAGR